MKQLFQSFASSRGEFSRVKEYWHELFGSCAEDEGASPTWEDWFSHDFEVDFCTDTIGVFSALNRTEGRGLSVNMFDFQSNNEIMGAYLDVFGEGTDSPVLFLTISCFLTEKTAAASKQLIKMWLKPDVSRSEMEAYVKMLLRDTGLK